MTAPNEARRRVPAGGAVADATRRDMTGLDGQLLAYAQEAALLWNAHRFFEVHEALEIPWRLTKHERKDQAAKDPRRDGYHCLILLAAAYVHWRRGNALGVDRKLADARRRFVQAPERLPGLHLRRFFAEVEEDLARARTGVAFDATRVPKWSVESA